MLGVFALGELWEFGAYIWELKSRLPISCLNGFCDLVGRDVFWLEIRQ